ncbi:hypothetical protein Q9R08_04965 [Microbacterium sp. QXD-8]|uniref:Uncharacterized protein n=1 Tax=Microbacterium psychrotolerans TaxID=3068321 RepID=A0ABU0YZX8_9MICO|nr:hypothetical protein [Microbacterium sp. QXD-8]MDQ7877323.1 hypothetical protein [Microbacterium sp. QXD-8]
MSAVVTGLDLSLAGSGVATIRRNGGGEVRISQHLIETEAFPKDYKPTLQEWLDRQSSIVQRVVSLVPDDALVVIETGSFRSKWGNPYERAGVFWRTAQWLSRLGHVVVGVTPAGRAKYAAGHARADKKAVVEAIQLWAPTIRNHNVADAAALAAMGWRHLGAPVDLSLDGVLERKKNEAMRAVRWPITEGVK